MTRTAIIACILALTGLSNAHANTGKCGVAKEPTDELANQLAEKAWDEHKEDFRKPTPRKNRKMPFTVRDKDGMADFIDDILSKRTKATQSSSVRLETVSKELSKDRIVWWENKTGTIVFHDPGNEDCGSAYRPDKGKAAYDDAT